MSDGCSSDLSKEVATANGTQAYGWGIRVMSTDESSRIENIRIQGCHIENIGHTGIKLTGARQHISRVWLYNNRDRKNDVQGKSVSVRVDLVGRRIINRKKTTKKITLL